ncbi:MAG: hypothetical protein D6775_16035 [Caldilineae bacterium]|nr:MAG: hypothetical protein D6775_16035 [Caldilineae bacterium]
MKARQLLHFLAVLLLAVLSLAAPAGAAGPVQATLDVPAKELAVGEPILLTLQVVHPPDHRVVPPDLGEQWGAFVVVSQSEPATIRNGDGTVTTSMIIDTRLFAPGSFTTPRLVIDLEEEGGGRSQITVAPVTVHILSSLAADDLELHDLKPQASLPTTALWLQILGLTLFLPFALALLHRAAIRRDNKAGPELLPADLAMAELDRIAALHLPEKGQAREYCTLLSQCVRRYLEQEFAVPVAERTTSEIRGALLREGLVPEVVQAFGQFLAMMDTVRFSQYTVDLATADYLMLLARRLFEHEAAHHRRPSALSADGEKPRTKRSNPSQDKPA